MNQKGLMVLALFGGKKSSQGKPPAKGAGKKAAEKKTNETKINVNKHPYIKTELGRRIQLTAFFHMLKLDLGHNAYSEMVKVDDAKGDLKIDIPYSFNLYETMCMAKFFMVDNWYIDIDKDNSVDIFFDEIVIRGTPEFTSTVMAAFKAGETFTSDFPLYKYDYKQGAQWQWEKVRQNQYQKCRQIGNRLFKNGSFMVYPLEESEIIVYKESDFRQVGINDVEYVALRSNIQPNKVLLFDNVRRIVVATGFDEMECLELDDFLNPATFMDGIS